MWRRGWSEARRAEGMAGTCFSRGERLVVGRFFGSRIASFRLLLKSNQFMFNSRESFVEFLKFVQACED